MYFKRLFLVLFLISSASFAFEEKDDHQKKCQEISLSRRILNPAKGVTVWSSPPQEQTISWASYGDFSCRKFHTEELPGDLEITISDFTANRDFFPVLAGLHGYNVRKMHPICFERRDIFEIQGGDIKGVFVGDSVIIFFRESPCRNVDIQILERELFLKGAQRLYMVLANSQKGLGPLCPVEEKPLAFSKHLQEMGYTSLSGRYDFDSGDYEEVLMKEVKEIPACPEASLSILWGEDPYTLNVPGMSENFGIFLRDSQEGYVKGGVWGTIKESAHTPHSYLEIFFIDDSLREKGLGKEIMTKVEEYTQSFGLGYVVLGTCSHQAPGFYEKIGFQRARTFPKFLKARKENEFYDFYEYFKDLK